MVLPKSLSKRGRKEGESIKRKSSIAKIQISAPVELLSTTNMISYTSRTLHNSPLSSSASPTNGRFFPLAASPSPSISPYGSDVESPSPPTSPVRPNHLSMYFSHAPVPPPMSPARSLSTRSTASHSAPSRSASTSSTSSRQRTGQAPPPKAPQRGMRTNHNPFGAELAEIAEELGLKGGDEEENYMYAHGLRKYNANDYLREIECPLFKAGWI